MTKRRHRALIGVGCFFAIVAIALAVFIATLDQNKAKKYISAGVSKITGRQLSINGDLKLDLGWISRLSASEIQFQNAGGRGGIFGDAGQAQSGRHLSETTIDSIC